MEIEIKLDESMTTPKLIIITDKITEEVSEIIERIKVGKKEIVSGTKGDIIEVIKVRDIVRIYSENKKNMIRTENNSYVSRQRLYEFEDFLDKKYFIRISNSEIINLHMVKNLDLSISGTICVKFLNGDTTFASRRYVARLKKTLEI